MAPNLPRQHIPKFSEEYQPKFPKLFKIIPIQHKMFKNGCFWNTVVCIRRDLCPKQEMRDWRQFYGQWERTAICLQIDTC